MTSPLDALEAVLEATDTWDQPVEVRRVLLSTGPGSREIRIVMDVGEFTSGACATAGDAMFALLSAIQSDPINRR